MSVYKGEKLVAGGSVNTYLARRPAWSKAIAISAADLVAGYTAPSDGIVVGSVHNTSLTDYHATINGVKRILITSRSTVGNSTIARPMSISTPLNKGDTLGCTAPNAADIIISPSLLFVPFEDSTVSESDVEVVTSELIRNLHDPDWSQAVSITATQLVEGYTVPKRGIIVGSIWSSKYTNAYNLSIEINNVSVLNARVTDKDVSYGNIQCPVCVDDKVRLVNIPASYCSYKISFVPYKAQ